MLPAFILLLTSPNSYSNSSVLLMSELAPSSAALGVLDYYKLTLWLDRRYSSVALVQ